jgi:hypothetical protein
MPSGLIPDWFELDDADLVDLLNDIRDRETAAQLEHDARPDPLM